LNFLDRCLEKYANIKFHENQSSGRRVLCGRDRLTDLTKLTVAFGNSAYASVTSQLVPYRETVTVCSDTHTNITAQCGQNAE